MNDKEVEAKLKREKVAYEVRQFEAKKEAEYQQELQDARIRMAAQEAAKEAQKIYAKKGFNLK